MTDFSCFHIATIANGQFDEHRDRDDVFIVFHDSKRYYYDQSAGSFDEFKSFVDEHWNLVGDREIEEFGNELHVS